MKAIINTVLIISTCVTSMLYFSNGTAVLQNKNISITDKLQITDEKILLKPSFGCDPKMLITAESCDPQLLITRKSCDPGIYVILDHK